MRCRRGTAGKAGELLNVGGVSGGGHMTAVGAGAGPSGGKTLDAQVTRTSGGRSINVEREVSNLWEINFAGIRHRYLEEARSNVMHPS